MLFKTTLINEAIPCFRLKHSADCKYPIEKIYKEYLSVNYPSPKGNGLVTAQS